MLHTNMDYSLYSAHVVCCHCSAVLVTLNVCVFGATFVVVHLFADSRRRDAETCETISLAFSV